MGYDIKLGTRILMVIPTLSSSPRTIAWSDAKGALSMPLGTSMGLKWIVDEKIADARNALCREAINAGVEYIFMLGDDVLPPPNAVMMLLDKIGREYPVVEGKGKNKHTTMKRASMITGVYWTKSYPPEPYIFDGLLGGSIKKWVAGEFFPVDFAGCDCLLIETAMLKQIPYPWFSTDWVWEPGQGPSSIATEDYYFYTKAREHGFRLWADTAIQCMHEDRYTGAQFGLTMDMPQVTGMFPKVVKGKNPALKLVADIGAGLSTNSELWAHEPNNDVKIMRFDIRQDTNPDVVCDIRQIDPHFFGQFDTVCSSHNLEHFRRVEAPGLLAHWVKLLKVGGKIIIHVPNIEQAMRNILNPPPNATDVDKHYWWQQVYGDQAQSGAPWQHLNGFTVRKLHALLSTIPELIDIEVRTEHDGQNLRAEATLGKAIEPYALTTAWAKIERMESESVNTPVEVVVAKPRSRKRVKSS